MENHVKILV